MKCKIVADSSANLQDLKKVDFAAVPLTIRTDEQEFVDTKELDLTRMLAHLAAYKGRSGTACPNVGDWVEAFGGAEEVFAIAITSNLSGSYNALVQAKQVYEDENPGKRVCTLDSLSAGPELALIAEKLRELLLAGKTFEETENAIRAYMTKTRLVFTLESLNNLARNGRVSPVVAKAAGILGIRIVGKASDEGTLQQLHKCRGEKKALEVMAREMKELGYRGGKVRISHCFNPVAAETLTLLLRRDFPDADITTDICGGLCSFYAEKGGMLVGFETE